MNKLQRMWSAGFCLAFAAGLFFIAFEWTTRSGENYGTPLLIISEWIAKPWEFDWSKRSKPKVGDLVQDEKMQTGLFIREQWNDSAFLWGGLLPVLLIFVGGYLLAGLAGHGGGTTNAKDKRHVERVEQ
jgi:hypothetical protein